MNKLLNFNCFINLVSLNENITSDKEISKDEVIKKLHDSMYNLVQKIAYGENQKEKSNSMYAWVSFFLPRIWGPIDKVTNPQNGLMKNSNNLDSSIKSINDCKIKIEMTEEELKKLSFNNIDDIKNLIATSSLSQEDRMEMLEVIKPLGEKYLVSGDLNIILDSKETKSFFNLPGVNFFGIKQGGETIQNHFQNIIETKLSKIMFQNFKNKVIVPSDGVKKPEVSDTTKTITASVKRKARPEQRATPTQSKLTTNDLSKWGL